MNKIYKLKGMDCSSCAMLVESELEDAGINAKVSYAKEQLQLMDKYDIGKIKKIITNLGYNLEEK